MKLVILKPKFIPPERKREPLSECTFLNTFQLATLLNAEYKSRKRYNPGQKSSVIKEEDRLKAFNEMSLEYKLANLYQVQRFANHFDRIKCFFTDRQVAFEELKRFSPEQLDNIGNWEHDAWANRKTAMGWHYGNFYTKKYKRDYSKQNNLREQIREHQYLEQRFQDLDEDKKQKDRKPIINFKKYMEAFQVRIYKFADDQGDEE